MVEKKKDGLVMRLVEVFFEEEELKLLVVVLKRVEGFGRLYLDDSEVTLAVVDEISRTDFPQRHQQHRQLHYSHYSHLVEQPST